MPSPDSPPSLAFRVTRVLSFNVLQTIVSKLMGAIQLALLLRLLPLSDIGAIGLSAGYVGILSILQIAPEAVFVRDFARFSKQLNETISAFLTFGAARGLFISLLGIPIAAWLIWTQGRADVGTYFLLFTLTTGINALSGPFREAFYAQYRQARITAVDLTTNLVGLFLIVGLFFYPHLLAYGIIQAVSALLGLAWWYWNARTHLHFRFALPHDWMDRTLRVVRGFSIGNHLTSNSFRIVYQADIIVLSFFVGLTDLGAYSVALTIANLFFILPQYVQKITTLSLSGDQPLAKIKKVFGLATKYNAILSILQFAGWLFIGPFILFLLGAQDPARVNEYAILLIAGTTLFNLVRPWMALLVARYDAWRLFVEIFLYPGLIALVVYAYAAYVGGILGVAWANIGVYGLLALLIVGFTYVKLHIVPDLFPIWGTEERSLLARVFKSK